MEDSNRTYRSAAGHDWALPFYDPFMRLLGADRSKRELARQAAIRPGDRVLDIGCGTGTLAVQLRRMYPEVRVTGLDPDPNVLSRARQKARKAGAIIRFDAGFADEMPYPDASFDRVLSSFMFHHVPLERKEKTLREVRRVLAPGGSLHLVDFVQTGSPPRGAIARWIEHHLEDNVEEAILALMRRAGFPSARKVAGGEALFGLLRMGYYQAVADKTMAAGGPPSGGAAEAG